MNTFRTPLRVVTALVATLSCLIALPVSAHAQAATGGARPAGYNYGSISYYYDDASKTGPVVGTFASDACNQFDIGYRTSYVTVRYVTCSGTPR